MKAKYAIKDLLRIHAVRKQTRKMFPSLLLHKKAASIGFQECFMQIEFMQFAHKHQFCSVTQNVQSAQPKSKHKGKMSRHKANLFKTLFRLETHNLHSIAA